MTILTALALSMLPLPSFAQERIALLVHDAEAIADALSGLPVIEVHLGKKAQTRFALFTGRNVGKRTDLIVDGQVLTSPVIQTQINTSTLQISGVGTMAEAVALAARLSAGAAMVEVQLAAD
ncbi:MAG: hypothetical protein KIT02_09045 [Devosia sp.]|uniref:SecDF P1 head subdomain-containing protein n=1 Tax=Devosia sp. TaxID=1871048 RepID=UPI0024C9339A|nr:hypothetical protein [Devosia sp.]UYN98130.1 MAG: hypothetical protein KIT02_09045 [Devosia sp.]